MAALTTSLQGVNPTQAARELLPELDSEFVLVRAALALERRVS